MTTYWAPTGGHPPQTDLLTDRAIVTEAYTVIPRGVLRDIVTSALPEWTDTRSWVLSKPVAGGAVTFSQTILEVAPGGGSEAPEPQYYDGFESESSFGPGFSIMGGDDSPRFEQWAPPVELEDPADRTFLK